MLLVDTFSSSEALGMGMSVSGKGSSPETASFTLGPDVKVLTEDGAAEVKPGSEEIGILALGGRNPLGYYKDTEKSDRTFKTIDGVRYSIPGDFAQVRADGSIHLLGRGSVCINSGGEKIYPEEVEESLKTHDAVRDAVVVGIPHPTFGEQIVAVVELSGDAGAVAPSELELIDHVKDRLASYKAPRRVRVVDTIGRAPNGKVDYKRHRDESVSELGAEAGAGAGAGAVS
jgi:fatty-acyl-CoA synthase